MTYPKSFLWKKVIQIYVGSVSGVTLFLSLSFHLVFTVFGFTRTLLLNNSFTGILKVTQS